MKPRTIPELFSLTDKRTEEISETLRAMTERKSCTIGQILDYIKGTFKKKHEREYAYVVFGVLIGTIQTHKNMKNNSNLQEENKQNLGVMHG